ncbi:MAG: acetylxylan esterase [Phycisphaeraceae bacterium]
MSIVREHLCRVAAAISDCSLASVTSLEQWRRERPQRYRQYLEMQGLRAGLPPQKDRSDLQVTCTGRLKRDDVVIEKLHFQSMPGLYVTANLYLPANRTNKPAPAVLYLCGHSRSQKVQYQPHPRQWARLGFVCLIMDTIEFGEAPGDHHGAYSRGQFHWHSRGYNPGAVEMWNGIRALDLLQQRPEVDGERMGVTGISGGGGVTWWIAAADERVKVAAPVCGTTTARSQVIDRCWDGQCDCLWFNNTYRWDLSDVAALVAPRPLMVASANRDEIFSLVSIRECYDRVQKIYQLHDAADLCDLVETPGPHSYHETSRKQIFAFFLKHLMGVDRPWQELDDVGEPQETDEALRVYENGPPADERTSTIQDDFVPLASPPTITDEASHRAERERVVTALRQQTFGHFPDQPCDLDVQVGFEYEVRIGRQLARLSFLSELDVRLFCRMSRPPAPQTGEKPGDVPGMLYLQEPEAEQWAFDAVTSRFPDKQWARMLFEPRGTGETSWGRELEWHMRRIAVLTGRTVASMQVYDALRALAVLREQPGIDAERVAIVGRGRMAVVAMYAALLDGGLESAVLIDPPATQNADDEHGLPGIEMLNCLRVTDLPQVAGLLWPTDLVFIGHRPATYAWAEQVHHRLGGRVVHALDMSGYHPRERARSKADCTPTA